MLSHESRELAERDLVASLERLRETRLELARNERLAVIGQITATVSHELRNPLGTLVTSVDLLRRQADAPKAAASPRSSSASSAMPGAACASSRSCSISRGASTR